MRHQHDRERGRRSRQRRRPPAERDQECAVPDQGDRAGRPEPAEVAATKRLERLCAGEQPAVLGHGPTLSSRRDRGRSGLCCSTSTSRSCGRGPSSALGDTRSSGKSTGSRSTRSGTPTRAGRPSPTCRLIPSSTTTRSCGCASRRTSCGGWAATARRSRTSRARSWAAGSTPITSSCTTTRCRRSQRFATAGYRLGLLSNTSRDLDAFVRHHAIEVDAWLSSGTHGKVKPSPAIFAAALDLVGVPADAGGDGRRLARRRHPRRAGVRDARDPRRPRPTSIPTSRSASDPCRSSLRCFADGGRARRLPGGERGGCRGRARAVS